MLLFTNSNSYSFELFVFDGVEKNKNNSHRKKKNSRVSRRSIAEGLLAVLWRDQKGTPQCGIIISLSPPNNKVHLVIVEHWPKNTRENKTAMRQFNTIFSPNGDDKILYLQLLDYIKSIAQKDSEHFWIHIRPFFKLY